MHIGVQNNIINTTKVNKMCVLNISDYSFTVLVLLKHFSCTLKTSLLA